ncbi:hypothetical protein [Anaeropeptidivorans aminofermentans]|uniref:hypothetical protein n=1 Tax=Anaeropeptidivorans aminofermentans TaxID=2934315 RepID=UPI002024AD5B|nr:hypothetical protein [Anaeropeptidivorans aminofermentans]MBE6013468.1 hypothetical protein [Lachnospiraceae bacterium]
MYKFMIIFKQAMLNTSFIALFISILSFIFPSYISLSNIGYLFIISISLISTYFIENNDNYSKNPLIYHLKNIGAIFIALFFANIIFKVMDINLVSITINIIFVFITYSLITAFYIYYNRKSAAEINKKLAEGRKARNGENN